MHRRPHRRHPVGQLAADGLRGGDRLVEVGQQPARAIQQRVAGDGQLHPVRRAAQQLAAQEPLDRADLAAQRRLREVQPRRSAAEVELLGDGDEGPQVPDLDAVGRLGKGEDLSGPLDHAAEYARLHPRPVMPMSHDRDARSAFPFPALGRQHRRGVDRARIRSRPARMRPPCCAYASAGARGPAHARTSRTRRAFLVDGNKRLAWLAVAAGTIDEVSEIAAVSAPCLRRRRLPRHGEWSECSDCPLCGNQTFQREEERTDSRWGLTTHVKPC